MVDDLRVLEVVEVLTLEQPRRFERALGDLGAVLGQDDLLLLLVDLDVGGRQRLHHLVDGDVQFRLVVGRAGDDQGGARFVDQDRIDLVGDGEVERPLDHLLAGVLHVVAQVVEAELVVRAVGDVGGVSRAAGVVVEVRHDDADFHAEEAVDAAHPLGVARREVVVDGDDVDALAVQRVEVHRQRRDQRLALAGPHLGDLAAVEDDAADQLNVVVALAERALRRLAHCGKRLGEQVVEGFTLRQPRPERRRLTAQRLVGHRRHCPAHGC